MILKLFICDRFSHESVGEGDDRHLILERGPETSVYVIVKEKKWEKYCDLKLLESFFFFPLN